MTMLYIYTPSADGVDFLTEFLRRLYGRARPLEVPVTHQPVVAARQQPPFHVGVPAQAVPLLRVSLAPVLWSAPFAVRFGTEFMAKTKFGEG